MSSGHDDPDTLDRPTLSFSAARSLRAKPVAPAIRPGTREDLPRVAEILRSQFLSKGTLLGRLSQGLLEAFYDAFIDRTTFLVHTNGGDVNGFVLGGSAPTITGCKVSFFRQHALLCVLEVLCRPSLWLRALGSLANLRRGWLSLRAGSLPREDYRMLSIAVNPSVARQGVGMALLQAFEAAIGQECHSYRLNVLKTNSAAIRFYEKAGFHYMGETPIAWTLRKELATNAGVLPMRRAA